MSRTRIKVCGLTRAVEVAWAAALGVDAIGLVFHPQSSRAVTAEQACEVLVGLPPFVTVTGLFMDAAQTQVEAVLSTVKCDLLQFHGEENAAFCQQFDRPYIKAIPMGGIETSATAVADYVEAYMHLHPQALGFLLDSHAVGEAGGSGKTFAWDMLPALARRVVLAGGLQVENVAAAIRLVHPYAVDVSSGVEKIRGQKDRDLMTKFTREVRLVEREFQQ